MPNRAINAMLDAAYLKRIQLLVEPQRPRATRS
jgi:hypothetical protein